MLPPIRRSAQPTTALESDALPPVRPHFLNAQVAIKSAPRAIAGWLVLIVAMVGMIPGVHAQELDEDSVKAVFLTRFASFVAWPEDSTNERAAAPILCIVGSPSLAEKVRANLSAAAPPLRVTTLERVHASTTCHILFAGIGAMQDIAGALSAVRGRPVLTVTDARNGESRGIIHFDVIDRRVRFHIDLEEAHAKRLQLNSRLLGVAASVRTPEARP